MDFEILSVEEAQERLPLVLERFRLGHRPPVGAGAAGKIEVVIVSAEVFDELTTRQPRVVG